MLLAVAAAVLRPLLLLLLSRQVRGVHKRHGRGVRERVLRTERGLRYLFVRERLAGVPLLPVWRQHGRDLSGKKFSVSPGQSVSQCACD